MSQKYKASDQYDTYAEENDNIDFPKQYKVILHNDDYTPMEFVVKILMDIFKKDEAAATQIMLTIHNQGNATCGVYTYEIAETKVSETLRSAQRLSYPLRASMEAE